MYRLLVSDGRVPLWTTQAIKGVAAWADLYTVSVSGADDDSFETWITDEFETPGIAASAKLVEGRRLTRDEWHALVRLYALQEVRTPQSFFEAMRRWDKDIPEVLSSTLKNATEDFLRDKRTGNLPKSTDEHPFAGAFDVRVTKRDDSLKLEAGIVVGRRLWVASLRHVLTGRALARLTDYTWSVLQPADGLEWPITDHQHCDSPTHHQRNSLSLRDGASVELTS